MRSPTKYNSSAQKAPTSASWASLPILGQVFNRITDPKDLVACACVCKSWSAEIASSDHLFQQAWTRQVSDQGLWRWARASGGYREQLRADHVVRKGDCVASVFPLNRRDGKISEVLLLDAKPEPRICTMHVRPTPAQCIRLTGWTVKVWSAATLCSQKTPLCTIHDVVKHLQLEDGRLFLWRIREGAIIRIRRSGIDGDAAAEEEEEINHWTENPNLIASVLDPINLTVVDIPLESTYGHRQCPFEYMDGGVSGVLIAAGAYPSENKLEIRLLDLHTGRCFRESSIRLPEVGPDTIALHPDGAGVLMSRNSDVGGTYVAAAVLYDCRVFRWRLKDEWLAVETRYNTDVIEPAIEPLSSQTEFEPPPQQDQEENLAAAGGGAQPTDAAAAVGLPTGDFADNVIDADNIGDIPNIPYGMNASIKTELAAQYSLHHIFTTVEFEPIVDLSMSTASQRIYVLGLEKLFILGESGTLQMTCPMYQWRGAHTSQRYLSTGDLGAFSWPLPNSKQAAFYLDVTNSLYIADFEAAAADSWPNDHYLHQNDDRHGEEPGRLPYKDRIMSLLEDVSEQHNPQYPHQWLGRTTMPVQSHTDLLPKPKTGPVVSFTGRLTRSPDAEPVIVEYIQSGKTIFTSGDSSCPGTAALLKAEKEAGTYLYGLGPKSVAGGKGTKAGPFVSRPVGSGGSSSSSSGGAAGGSGGGSGGDGRKKQTSVKLNGSNCNDLAPRALICIDAKTGRRYKTVPIEGIIESVHAAGHLLVAAVAPKTNYPEGAEGSLVVIDFSKEGFGLTDAQRKEYIENNKKVAESVFGKNSTISGGKNGSGGMKALAVTGAEVAAGLQKSVVSTEAGPSKAKRRRRNGK